LLLVLFLLSCDKQNEETINGDIFSRYYIARYHLATDTIKSDLFKKYGVPLLLSVTLEGKTVDESTDSELYRELAKRYGDGGFFVVEKGNKYDIMVDTLSSITITSNKDYDAAHPAGEPLDDIISIEYESARIGMDLFYNEKTQWDEEKFVHEELTSFNGVAHPLLGTCFFFSFKTFPALKEIFDLTITGRYKEEILFQRTIHSINPNSTLFKVF
jgi:hypothetical protein